MAPAPAWMQKGVLFASNTALAEALDTPLSADRGLLVFHPENARPVDWSAIIWASRPYALLVMTHGATVREANAAIVTLAGAAWRSVTAQR